MAGSRKSSKTSHLWRPAEPFNALPLLPPKVELENKTILKRCIAARAALAEWKQAGEFIPNQCSSIRCRS
jgi:hypothetical protein